MGVLSDRPVVTLTDDAARLPEVAGAKAASLAKAAAAGLPVLPGVVLTTAGVRARDLSAMRHGWEFVSERGARPVVVRSSSTAEDGVVSSMAGLFTSILDVRDWRGFLDAVEEVVASGDSADMAVLVQPFLEPDAGGVLFGADPISARRDRMVVDAVNGGPHRLVQGQVSGDRWTLTPHGRVVEHIQGSEVVALGPHRRWALTGMARRAAALLGGPQDIEWAFDRAGKLWLLQSRPITTLPASGAEGPVYGPGPVAETFPDALLPLEEDLWLDPLRVALREALSITGTAPKRVLRQRPLVISVGGRVAVDLQVLGSLPPKHRMLAKLNPRPPARRVKASWRVGRLRAALPALAEDLLAEVDGHMAAVPALRDLRDDELLTVLERSRQALVAVHGHEVLMGLLVKDDVPPTTAAALALRQLAAGQAAGMDEDALVAHYPLTLVLRPPTVGMPTPLPEAPRNLSTPDDADGPAVTREALRARVRLLQELGARAAREMGRRLGRDIADVARLRLDQLAAAVGTGTLPTTTDAAPVEASELPVAFRLTSDGHVVPLPRRGNGGTGVGAGGGRGAGIVHIGDDPPEGSVLLVRHLEPSLAGVLPRLAGIVAETGSVLSHLAILAREMGVPVVVACPDALTRFPEGTTVTVDGTTGEVVSQ